MAEAGAGDGDCYVVDDVDGCVVVDGDAKCVVDVLHRQEVLVLDLLDRRSH